MFNPQNSLLTVKHGGGIIVLWGFLLPVDLVLLEVNGIMKEDNLQAILKSSGRTLGLEHS